MPFKPQQFRLQDFEGLIHHFKKAFDKEAPCYPFVAKIFSVDGKLIAQQVFTGPFSRPKIQIVMAWNEEWDMPVTLRCENGHQHEFRTRQLPFLEVDELVKNIWEVTENA